MKDKSTNNDSRFDKLQRPIFKEIPKKIKKIEIEDKRFDKMFNDKRFNEGLEKDVRGYKVKSKYNIFKIFF